MNLSIERVRRWLIGTTIAGFLLLVVGDWHDGWLWAYVAAFAGIGLYAMTQMDDDLARERFRPPSAGADRLSLRTVRLVALAHIVGGILDSRYKWTHMSDGWRAIGIAGFAASFLFMIQAIKANRFFSAVVRIQSERGHRVVDQGPYRIVRHPGYAAMIPMMPFSGMALGSWIAVALSLIYSGLILRRVFFEDSFLRQNLEGYAEYTTRVRYRLVPGLW
jgi:protein-S-isoprenylcysteine O-methyltransferase Ste14